MIGKRGKLAKILTCGTSLERERPESAADREAVLPLSPVGWIHIPLLALLGRRAAVTAPLIWGSRKAAGPDLECVTGNGLSASQDQVRQQNKTDR